MIPHLVAEEEQPGSTNGRHGSGELGGYFRDEVIHTLSPGGGKLARGANVPANGQVIV